LPGTHSTRASLKRLVAEGEVLLVRWVEPQMALGGAMANPVALTDALWKAHLTNCAHDAVAGCCTDAVATDVVHRAGEVIDGARAMLVDAAYVRVGYDRTRARRETPTGSCLLVLNPSPRARRDVVEATLTFAVGGIAVGGAERVTSPPIGPPPNPVVVGASGDPVPLQILDYRIGMERLDAPRDYPVQDVVHAVRVVLVPPPVDPLGIGVLTVRAGDGAGEEGGDPVADPVRGDRRGVSGGGREVSARVVAGFRIRADGAELLRGVDLMSEADLGDTYTFQPGDVPPRSARWEPPVAGWRGPLAAGVSRGFRIEGDVTGTVHARVDSGSTLVRLVAEGTNHTCRHRLRVRLRLPRGARPETTTADMVFGPQERDLAPVDRRGSGREWPVATAPVHRYLVVPLDEERALLVLVRGIREYEVDRRGRLHLTILRAVDQLSRGDLPARPGHAGWPSATPAACEPGGFRVEIGVAPVPWPLSRKASAWSMVEQLSEEFHGPIAALMVRRVVDSLSGVRGPELVGEALAVKTVYPARAHAGAVVVRAVNVSDVTVRGAWHWPQPVHRAARARLDETVLSAIPVGAGDAGRGWVIPFDAAPREIVTILVWPGPSPGR